MDQEVIRNAKSKIQNREATRYREVVLTNPPID